MPVSFNQRLLAVGCRLKPFRNEGPQNVRRHGVARVGTASFLAKTTGLALPIAAARFLSRLEQSCDRIITFKIHFD
jgi:hypothetical protein